MSSIKPSSRYPSFETTRSSTSSQLSDPSSSSEFKNISKNQSSLKRLMGGKVGSRRSPDLVPAMEMNKPIVKSRIIDMGSANKVKQEQNLTSLVKKFMDKRSKPKTQLPTLVIPADFIKEDLKKTGVKGSKFSSFQKKLFQKGSNSGSEVKALTEVKANTRTLAMVLRSERELLSQNKEFEMEVTELKLIIEEKSREVDKLKDLCLNQREEIKSLKSAILFPDVMNSHLQELLEKQGSELKQAKQVIPSLQQQVSSLTGQLQCLADDLAETPFPQSCIEPPESMYPKSYYKIQMTQVKADKYSVRACYEDHMNSPRTPAFDQDATNSLEYSSGDPTTPGTPDDMFPEDMNPCSDDMFLKDLNPCLTPYFAKSKEFDEMGYNSPQEEGLFGSDTQGSKDNGGKISKSSEYWGRPSLGGLAARANRRSEENKCTYGKPLHHKLF